MAELMLIGKAAMAAVTGGAVAGGTAAAAGTGFGSLGSILSLGGTVMSAGAQIGAANDAKKAAEYNARVDEEAAQAERASAIQEAKEERRQSRLLQSRAIAVGAASGGGIDIEGLSDIETEGEKRAQLALWGGEERARGRESGAVSSRLEASAKASASRTRATGTLISGGMSWLDKYGPRSLAGV